MASIFTFELEPARVASPWLQGDQNGPGDAEGITGPSARTRSSIPDLGDAQINVTRLQAEPQDGPVEYKLHLLLRPRRKFRSTSTGSYISGSKHARYGGKGAGRTTSETLFDSNPSSGAATPPIASTHQTRQHRLEQLTTQLLWRLQQSSPHHTSSATNIILPSLPEALPELQAPRQPAKLLHGLEESQGALYEIGVSDDGTLVGLAQDEMLESLNNLRAMAACMGCAVEVLREETVGECEWLEEIMVDETSRMMRRTGHLVVAEALVKPVLQSKSPSLSAPGHAKSGAFVAGRSSSTDSAGLNTDQLRVSLTGPTMSGKSTLLGTLTTSTLDNGRGKSRLSMLKHRHEITSGLTSSVTQELLGFQECADGSVEVVNYATENISSWIDIHVAAASHRLAFISDSAGHPRYKRTTLRGLVGWAPHWTLLCIPADGTGDTASLDGSPFAPQQSPGTSVTGLDLIGAQLDLCLRLDLPLVIVITKLDLASRNGLRESLSKVLDALKAVGKKPAILANKPGSVVREELRSVNATSIDAACRATESLREDPHGAVPIVLTSAVEGTGISNLLALLHQLPTPRLPRADVGQTPQTVFDVEDIYSKPAEISGVVISGRLRSGSIRVGDSAYIGPFASHESSDDSEDSDERSMRVNLPQLPASRSFPGALRAPHVGPLFFQLTRQEWQRVKIVSIRNLRLPVQSLLADQVATIAIELEDTNDEAWPLSRARKGMVLAQTQPIATRSFTAIFRREDLESLAVGTQVVVYIASVRASARVVSARAPDSPAEVPRGGDGRPSGTNPFSFEDFESALDETSSMKVAGTTASDLLVTFAFDASKEFVSVHDRVLVMPGGGPGLAGLDGFVGKITDVCA